MGETAEYTDGYLKANEVRDSKFNTSKFFVCFFISSRGFFKMDILIFFFSLQ